MPEVTPPSGAGLFEFTFGPNGFSISEPFTPRNAEDVYQVWLTKSWRQQGCSGFRDWVRTHRLISVSTAYQWVNHQRVVHALEDVLARSRTPIPLPAPKVKRQRRAQTTGSAPA